MAGPISAASIPDALGRYQQRRLGPAARHVTVSERATAAYLGRSDLALRMTSWRVSRTR
jgi:hypothetical protein